MNNKNYDHRLDNVCEGNNLYMLTIRQHEPEVKITRLKVKKRDKEPQTKREYVQIDQQVIVERYLENVITFRIYPEDINVFHKTKIGNVIILTSFLDVKRQLDNWMIHVL